MFVMYIISSASNHPCLINNGGCEHLCIPKNHLGFTCACAVGFKKDSDRDTSCSDYKTFAVVTQLDITRGYSLKDSAEAMVPISGPGECPGVACRTLVWSNNLLFIQESFFLPIVQIVFTEKLPVCRQQLISR